MVTIRTTLLLLLLLAASAGCDGEPRGRSDRDASAEPSNTEQMRVEGDLDAPDPQEEWELQEGDAWDEYASAYSDGWAEGCARTMALGDGLALYYGDDAVDLFDCKRAEEDAPRDPPVDVPDDPAGDGEEAGVDDACSAVFDDLAPIGSLGRLYYGDEEFTSLDCNLLPVVAGGSASPAAPTSPAPSARGTDIDAVLDCPSFDTQGIVGNDGAGFYNVSVRNIDCESVRTLMVAWLDGDGFEGRMGYMLCDKLSEAGETASYRCSNHGTPEQAVRFDFGT